MRVCKKCGGEKPDVLFVKDHRKPGGLGYSCRACAALRHKEYDARPEVRHAKVVRASLHQIDPIKLSARRKLKDAVRRGKINKPKSCQACGLDGHIIHGHHEDYSRPLDVVWLCPKCHMKRHQVTAALLVKP